ncbi:hypothetical protein MNBD_GAMMA10-1632 [hydrothermal vent metagenome]|uniref:Uncharacterized protein n=1 Tax=hydrothermal vent metagenome TaxID=652676 RepID=A0A3B0Y7B2_9ZZZZ
MLKKGDALKNKLELIKKFKGASISNFIRAGSYSNELSDREKQMPCKKDSFISDPGVLVIDIGGHYNSNPSYSSIRYIYKNM